MFYKFVGGDDDALLDVFDKAVVQGAMKFGAARAFNDPFEFKFSAVAPPSREDFENWHLAYAPDKTPDQRNNAWAALSGTGSDWNMVTFPRITMLGSFYVLCLARRWDSHLMWGHYARSHRGFVVCYKPAVLEAFQELPGHLGQGDVDYREGVPELRWFTGDPNGTMASLIASKSAEWAYEAEYRVVLTGTPVQDAVFHAISPDLIAGVILGARAPEALICRALDLRRSRPDFTVDQASSKADRYELLARRMNDDSRTIGDFL